MKVISEIAFFLHKQKVVITKNHSNSNTTFLLGATRSKLAVERFVPQSEWTSNNMISLTLTMFEAWVIHSTIKNIRIIVKKKQGR